MLLSPMDLSPWGLVSVYNLIDQKEVEKMIKAGILSANSMAMWVMG